MAWPYNHGMRTTHVLALAPALLLLAVSRAEAGKVPLTPEQLRAESKLIVTGRVVSHRTEDREEKDRSVTRLVFLTVKVEAVEKGDAKPGDVIECRCWVVVREPRGGEVWDSGHHTIPGDGGKARFFCDGFRDGIWSVIYPNGVELLDQTPPLRFEREKAPRMVTDDAWPWFLGGAVVLMGVGAAVGVVVLRRAGKSE